MITLFDYYFKDFVLQLIYNNYATDLINFKISKTQDT